MAVLIQWMMSKPTLYRAIRQALDPSGEDTSHGDMELPRNAPVEHKCILATWGVEAGSEIVPKSVSD